MSSSRCADVPLGMMDGAYFTSRKDILDFFNSHLSMNLSKIEDTASGAVACQLMDLMFPGSVPIKRINWGAKSEFQYIENYKILQAAFTKKNVQKQVDVDRLIRAKYQDNLEFCQWLKAFFQHASPASREDYDPLSRRQLGKGGKNLDDIFKPKGMKKNGTRASVSSRNGGMGSSGGFSSSASLASTSSRARPSSARPSSAVSASSRDMKNVKNTNKHGPSSTIISRQQTIMTKKGTDSVDAQLLKKNTDLKRRNAELELTLDNIEKERDFYFEKLRGIEVMLQVHEEVGEESDAEALIQRVYKVLYAKIEDDIIVTDDGELVENDELGLDGEDSVITMDDMVQ